MRTLKWIILLVVVLVLALAPATGVLAATSEDVTVTADPLFISISNDPNTWNLNSTGISVNTTYYSNPLGDSTPPSSSVTDGECRFTVTNAAAAETVDLTITVSDFTGGDATMTNSNDGGNGATTFGSYCWYSGMTYSSKVIAKSSGSDEMYSTGLAAEGTLKWGAEIETRTNDWTGGSSSTSTMTITATAH